MNKKIVVVLGMHRSGTSAIAKGIVELGAHPGNNLLPEQEDNPKGYWENADIVNLNNNILNDFYMSWHSIDNPMVNRFQSFLPFYEEKYIDQAIEIVNANFQVSNTLLIKDPRISILLPFWKKVFNKLEVDVKYILAIRNPIETAKSLLKRDKMDIKYGIRLWTYYNYMILKNINSEMLVCSFSTMLENPIEEMERISNYVNIDRVNGDIEDYRKKFLDQSLKHHNDDLNKLIECVGKEHISVKLFEELHRWSKKLSIPITTIESIVNLNVKSINSDLQFNNMHIENVAQLFLNWGNGFSEENSYRKKVRSITNVLNFEFGKHSFIKEIRFDPSVGSCMISVNNLELQNNNQIIDYLITGGNFQYKFDNFYIFEDDDPQILIKPNDSKIDHISIDYSMYPLDARTLLLLKQDYINKNYELNSTLHEQKLNLDKYHKEILLNRQELTKKDQELQEYIQALHEKNQELKIWQENVRIKELEIINTSKTLKEKELELTSKEEIIKEKELELTSKKEIIKDKEQELLEFFTLMNQYEVLKYQRPFQRILMCVMGFGKLIKSPSKQIRILQNKRLLKKSGLFNFSYYMFNNRDVVKANMDVLEHFIEFGWKEGRNPNPNFNIQLFLLISPKMNLDSSK